MTAVGLASSNALVATNVEISSPAPNKSFALGTGVSFSGRCGSDVHRVDIMADQRFPMGRAQISNGTWKFTHKFSASGMRRIEALAFDDKGKFLELVFVDILIKAPEISSARKALVSVATGQLGTRETPLGSNNGSQIRKYFDYCNFAPPEDWCFMFLNWVYNRATNDNPPWGKQMAFVPSVVAWAKNNKRWIRENDPHKDGFSRGTPKPGDLIIMGDNIDLNIRQNYPHIEMVIRVTPNVIHTIGGNVSPGEVGQRQHPRSGLGNDGRYIAGYVDVKL